MRSLFKKIKNNQQGTIILLTFLILSSVLTVAIGVSNLVLVNLKMGGAQAQATKAFFAAEAGAEQVLWEIRKQGMRPGQYGYDCKKIGSNFCFDNVTWRIIDCNPHTDNSDCSDLPEINILGNQAHFQIQYEYDDITDPSDPTTTLTSFGSYGETNRTVELTY